VSDAGLVRPVELSLESGIGGLMRVGTVAAAPVEVARTAGDLEREIRGFTDELRESHAGRTPAEILELAPARELYRIFGIDPTKTRPSSEKLLRRVLQKKPLPRISNAVDLGNLLALRFLLPIGLFDASKIDPPVQLRPGRPGEAYEGIASQEVHLAGRPVLSDRQGPFGNPTADSKRTAVDASTRALWLTVFAPISFPAAGLEAHLRTAAESFERHLAGPTPPKTETTVVE
jgi:DNA/RNA-binding domain of Phe-tRNA-synthetase-like protein